MNKNILLSISTLAILIGSISCNTIKMVEDPMKASPKVVMSKGACFGECPVYTLTIYNTGLMKFNGVIHTKMDGKHERNLDEESYKALIKLFDKINLWKYDDVYDMDIVDLPTTSISYAKKNKIKTIKGKMGRPVEILELENYLESLIYQAGWSMKEAPPVEKITEVIDDEIIIKGNNKMILVRWLKDYKKYGLRIGKRLGPESEYWLIRFDKSLIEPAEMLKMIQDDPAIQEAEFNKKISMRN